MQRRCEYTEVTHGVQGDDRTRGLFCCTADETAVAYVIEPKALVVIADGCHHTCLCEQVGPSRRTMYGGSILGAFFHGPSIDMPTTVLSVSEEGLLKLLIKCRSSFGFIVNVVDGLSWYRAYT
jgi:hypothetical protein